MKCFSRLKVNLTVDPELKNWSGKALGSNHWGIEESNKKLNSRRLYIYLDFS